MPSYQHEALLLSFRNRPVLAAELLRDALQVALPEYSEARIESAQLTEWWNLPPRPPSGPGCVTASFRARAISAAAG